MSEDSTGFTNLGNSTGFTNLGTSTSYQRQSPDDLQNLGHTANIIILVCTFTLAFLAVSLNVAVLTFYRSQIRNLVPFIYSILGGSDLCTGICAGLHSLIFLVLLIVKDKENVFLFWITFLTYNTTMISFRLSAFVSLVFSVIRTINILSPFSRISKIAVYISIVFYFAILLALTSAEIGVLWRSWHTDSILFMKSHFFRPGTLTQLYLSLLRGEITLDDKPECAISWASTLPTILPATLALIATVVQIYSLVIKPKVTRSNIDTGKETEGTKKRISITIATISTLFFLCSLFMLAQPIISCNNHIKDVRRKRFVLYMCGYMAMFLNAALNPLILVLRGEKLNKYIRDKLGIRQGQSEERANVHEMRSMDKEPGKRRVEGGSTRGDRWSIDTVATQVSVNMA